jgi:hypothetical protein
MKPVHGSRLAAALYLAQLALASHAYSAELTLPANGWTSWEVAAVDAAPAWCCWNNSKDASPTACRLDSDNDNFGSRGNATTDTVSVYAHLMNGKVDRLRVLSAACPVEAATPIHKLGSVPTDNSARWLIDLTKQSNTQAGTRRNFSESLLAALAIHRGSVADDALAAIAHDDARKETRKTAVFWLALLRGSQGADVVTSVMFNDKDADLREHAAFAITQSKSPRAATELIRLGNTDREGRVRAQAWFWLARMGAPEAETAIVAALKKDTDEHVRNQGMAALAQLPDDRATRALIAAAQDQTLSREQRKQAVFWLAQSESEAAQSYLEKILTMNAAD